MSKVVTLPTPTVKNTVMNENEVREFKPIYAKPNTLMKLYDLSRTSVYRLLKRAKNEGFENVEVSVSQGMTLVHIETFNDFLKSINKKHL